MAAGRLRLEQEMVEMNDFSNQERDPEANVNGDPTVQVGPQPCICQQLRQPIDYWPSDSRLAGEYRKKRVALYTAALNGDWKIAESIINDDGEFLNSSITQDYKTALHIAVGANKTAFVKALVNLLERNSCLDLALQDENGNTAFCHAVMAGNVPISKILMDKNPNLALIRGGQNKTPLFIAVIFGRHEMAQLLYEKTEDHLDHLEPEHLEELFFTCIQTDMFDLAFKLLERNRDLAVTRKRDGDRQITALHMLARKPLAFGSKRPGIIKRLINAYKRSEDISALQLVKKLWINILERDVNVRQEISSPFSVLFKAAKLGNYEFLAELIHLYPDLIWATDDMNRTIFHIAVLHRQVNIFNQIYSIGSIKDVVVTYKIPRDAEAADNILHLAAKMPLPHRLNTVSGAALQMQQELLWFEEVNSIVQPNYREAKGSENLTPRKLFSKEHEKLLEKGEKWMRDTSNSCMIVATLITTVVYSAGFSTPGGNNNNNGAPVQISHTLFHVFAISEGIALSFSIISMFMFLYILTSRYAEKDFLKSLPLKLMVGLATLFISMMAMVVAFSVAFLLAYRDYYNHQKVRWVPLLVSAFVSLSVASFVFLQYPLLRDIFHSIFFSHSLFRPRKSLFYFKM